MEKKQARQRRGRRTRLRVRELGVPRLNVHRTPCHIYAQVIVGAELGDRVLAAASTRDKETQAEGGKTGNVASAAAVGKQLAKRALAAGVSNVAFDRSGFKYHGVIKALAESAREAGLQF